MGSQMSMAVAPGKYQYLAKPTAPWSMEDVKMVVFFFFDVSVRQNPWTVNGMEIRSQRFLIHTNFAQDISTILAMVDQHLGIIVEMAGSTLLDDLAPKFDLTLETTTLPLITYK